MPTTVLRSVFAEFRTADFMKQFESNCISKTWMRNRCGLTRASIEHSYARMRAVQRKVTGRSAGHVRSWGVSSRIRPN